MLVPTFVAILVRVLSPLLKLILLPTSSSFVLLIAVTSLTLTILAKASPLNPSEYISYKSLKSRILDVACLLKASSISSLLIPDPLSVTLI